MRKFTKKERASAMTLLVGILAWSILSAPIRNIFQSLGVSDLGQIIIGLLILIGGYWFFNLK